MKDTVKDIIAPSWLSDFVKSVRKPSPEKNDEIAGPFSQNVEVSHLIFYETDRAGRHWLVILTYSMCITVHCTA